MLLSLSLSHSSPPSLSSLPTSHDLVGYFLFRQSGSIFMVSHAQKNGRRTKPVINARLGVEIAGCTYSRGRRKKKSYGE